MHPVSIRLPYGFNPDPGLYIRLDHIRVKPVFFPDRTPENIESVRIVTGEFADTDTVAGKLRIITELVPEDKAFPVVYGFPKNAFPAEQEVVVIFDLSGVPVDIPGRLEVWMGFSFGFLIDAAVPVLDFIQYFLLIFLPEDEGDISDRHIHDVSSFMLLAFSKESPTVYLLLSLISFGMGLTDRVLFLFIAVFFGPQYPFHFAADFNFIITIHLPVQI